MPTASTLFPAGSAAQTWREALAELRLHLSATRAKKTDQFYDAQLRPLTRWADEISVSFGGFGERHLDRYLVERSKTVGPTTLRHDAVAAKAFFRWCQKNDLIERSSRALRAEFARGAGVSVRELVYAEGVGRAGGASESGQVRNLRHCPPPVQQGKKPLLHRARTRQRQCGSNSWDGGPPPPTSPVAGTGRAGTIALRSLWASSP